MEITIKTMNLLKMKTFIFFFFFFLVSISFFIKNFSSTGFTRWKWTWCELIGQNLFLLWNMAIEFSKINSEKFIHFIYRDILFLISFRSFHCYLKISLWSLSWEYFLFYALLISFISIISKTSNSSNYRIRILLFRIFLSPFSNDI